jgi:arylformamidase
MLIKYNKMIDLSLKLENDMAIYPGDPPIDITSLRTMEKDRVNMLGLNMSTHHGTHLDAPRHQLAEGESLDTLPLNMYINRAMKIDLVPVEEGPRVKQKEGILYHQIITAEDLNPFAEKWAWVKAIVICTGYGRVLLKGKADRGFPYLDVSAAELLAGYKNLEIVGIDSLSVDAPGEKIAHHTLFGSKNRLLLETLVGLDQLPLNFTLCCFPLSIKNADGAPCRAIGLYE